MSGLRPRCPHMAHRDMWHRNGCWSLSGHSGHRASRTNKLDLWVRALGHRGLRFPRWQGANGSRERAPDDGRGHQAIHSCRVLICPTGYSVVGLSSPICKKIPLRAYPKSLLYPPPFRPTEGRVAIVTNAGWNAVDADAPITNGVEADGEVVWS